ncbi:VCBS repeat-containing protein [Pedobacter sp. Leaf170]|uniref:FG-GAP repeat domain-containing protein n=1 Tax=Pedobacter sp. Leaf170 TaxID=2876558 RepID=UPI001E5EA63F|nr:VCBS repeat-containing protein [Pedobacter sp. Leaf170]
MIITIALFSAMVFYILGKSNLKTPKQNLNFYAADDQRGELLAKRYCSSCHQFPEPALLPKNSWRAAVLPAMGMFLGVETPSVSLKAEGGNLIPSSALLSIKEWQAIKTYYIDSAPERLAEEEREEITFGLPSFEVLLPKQDIFYSNLALATYVKISPESNHCLLIQNGISNQLYQVNARLDTLKSSKLPGTLVDMDLSARPNLATFIGENYMASQSSGGRVYELSPAAFHQLSGRTPIFSSLSRPVKSLKMDLNGDGLKDILIGEFGRLTGQLLWAQASKNGTYKKHILRPMPGIIDFIITDENSDGKADIYALFAQGDEGIFLFRNLGNGKFDTEKVLSFPPVYGSSSFELVDFNQDGFKDLLYTCGDNADLSPVLKPYHGIYIFFGDEKGKFRKSFFYPMNGCYKAIAHDFDLDGDLDIASISAFPAASSPWEAFIYLQNQGNLSFKGFTLAKNVPFQKGLTMDSGDFNGDGKIDLLLGNKYYSSDKGGESQPLFVLLQNTSSVNKKTK